MLEKTFQVLKASEVTDEILQEAVNLFNSDYGVWGPNASKMIPSAIEGQHVELTKERLRELCLFDVNPGRCNYARCLVNGELAGSAFSCRWKNGNKDIDGNAEYVCWITQLVVKRKYREQRVATELLGQLKNRTDAWYGIASSHAAACMAAARAFNLGIKEVDLEDIKNHTKKFLAISPIKSLQDGELCGTCFGGDGKDGIISNINTQFFVDHKEAQEAIQLADGASVWGMGQLLDGHEFVMLVPDTTSATSRHVSGARRSAASSFRK